MNAKNFLWVASDNMGPPNQELGVHSSLYFAIGPSLDQSGLEPTVVRGQGALWPDPHLGYLQRPGERVAQLLS